MQDFIRQKMTIDGLTYENAMQLAFKQLEYKLVHQKSRGYAMFKRSNIGWEQASKWYKNLANLYRYYACAKNTQFLYQQID